MRKRREEGGVGKTKERKGESFAKKRTPSPGCGFPATQGLKGCRGRQVTAPQLQHTEAVQLLFPPPLNPLCHVL